MEPERWRLVEQLYHATLEHDPGARPAFLKEASADDADLLHEVEGLLACQEQSEDFIEVPALEMAAYQEGAPDLLGHVRDALRSALDDVASLSPRIQPIHFRLTTGAKLGPYEILEPLGAGGMGEVYSARDSRLGRTVALKILTAGVMARTEQRIRFEREARAISRLNHPTICILHDIGRDRDIDYLVMEYVEGQTLADRLKRGGLPLSEAINIAIAISAALDYAHKCGVIHRDLKPANIMLTKRGPKLVDFGLARWGHECEERVGAVPLEADVSVTMTGAFLGTPQYMAPERIDRHEVDARSDIFALGAVIFEMVRGVKAFEGATSGEIIEAIRAGAPPGLQDLQPTLKGVIERCLKRSPEHRWQSANELMEALKRIEEQSTRRASTRFRALVGIGGALAALIFAVWAVRTAARRAVETTDQVLYTFSGQNGDGAAPAASVTAGRNGILYGTTAHGGTYGKGTVFELSPPSSSGVRWTSKVLYSFGGADLLSHPIASLVVGEDGALYGTASAGILGRGAVFELRPPSTLGGDWTERVLHNFSTRNGDGFEPRSELAIGSDLATGKGGALYGTTVYGGIPVEDGRGIVFELIPPDLPGRAWTEKVLYRFTGAGGDGAFPYGPVVIDETGALYGTTFGGPPRTATIFKLTPPPIGDADWKETVLHTFAEQPAERVGPVAGLAMGKGGALYGTTQWGGVSRTGMAYELKPPQAHGGVWLYSVLYKFTSHIGDGAEPASGLVVGQNQELYGVTVKGGPWGNGTVFKLAPSSGSWTETVLYSFTGQKADGANPECLGHLLFSGKALYGTTEFGGTSNAGTVFKIPLKF